jgi:SpoVK/Ycf46/Vps4 family AAA+-type ATPase
MARDLAKATGRCARSHRTGTTAFDPGLSRADHDLQRLGDQLAASDEPWSLLLHGLSGTGKSAFAQFVADRSGRDLIVRTGSELLGAYVGQTEQAIASAFEEALDCDGILLIDEADDFMFDRSRARQSWETSMVNEMLRQMDGNTTRFVATTNRPGDLDPATARRFSLAVEFMPLSIGQACNMFMATFGLEAPLRLRSIGALTPGDFDQVHRRARLLQVADPGTICCWLALAAADRGAGFRVGF